MWNLRKIQKFSLIAVICIIVTSTYFWHFRKIGRIKKIGKIKTIYKIRLDTGKAPNESIILQHISKEMPYLPIEDLNNADYKSRNLNQTCAWYPSLKDIQIHNDYWQEFHNTNVTYYIFGAYLDNRPSVAKVEPVIRILTMIHFFSTKDEDYPKTYCQFWYKEQRAPIIMPANVLHRLWYYQWGHGSEHNYGHFLTCNLPHEHEDWIPKTVSLVSAPCDKATNNVRVVYFPLKENELKQQFAICVKGLDYPYNDISHRLVEYMETMRSLGAHKIIMYNLQVHPNVTKVLKHYENSGYLDVHPLSVSLEFGNLHEYRHLDMTKNYFPYVLHEVIPYNDCFYRNMYRYDYIAVVDIDEVIMPLGNLSNWHDLIEFGENFRNKNCTKFASFCFHCIYFPRFPQKPLYTTEIPEYFYMLQHVERVRDHIRPGWYTKCFHNTKHVIATHNHLPFHYTKGGVCRELYFNATDAQLQHYREPREVATLNDTVIDTSLWRFKDEIIKRSVEVLKRLKFLEEVDYED